MDTDFSQFSLFKNYSLAYYSAFLLLILLFLPFSTFLYLAPQFPSVSYHCYRFPVQILLYFLFPTNFLLLNSNFLRYFHFACHFISSTQQVLLILYSAFLLFHFL